LKAILSEIVSVTKVPQPIQIKSKFSKHLVRFEPSTDLNLVGTHKNKLILSDFLTVVVAVVVVVDVKQGDQMSL
jgi:hypothetical protein